MHAHSYGVIPLRTRQGELSVLIVRHREGHWSFPKGTPEQGEKPIDTAQREFHEETGIAQITIDPNAMFTEEYAFRQFGDHTLNVINKKVTYFLGWMGVDGNNQWNAHDEGVTQGKWVSLEKAKKIVTFNEARAILDEVKTYLDKSAEKGV